ncbi:MAG: hypothetical protein GY816_00180 [Cytophagales bacterium]|nr:hypothetical protein [Cytophagales bacterium]
MKLFNYIILALLTGSIFMSCDENPEFGFEESVEGMNFRMIPDLVSYNLFDADPTIVLTTYTESGAVIDNVTTMVEYAPFGGTTTQREVLNTFQGSELTNDGSKQITIRLLEVASLFGIDPGLMLGGDRVNIYNIVTTNSGLIFPDTVVLDGAPFINVENALITAVATTSFTSNLSFPIVCPSDLASTREYNIEVIVGGTCCGLPTGSIGQVRTVTVAEVDTGKYEISDVLSDYLAPFFGSAPEPLVVDDVCNLIYVDGAITSCSQASALCYIPNTTDGVGSYDPDTDTWVIKWEDAFGNGIRGITTLTPL